MQPPAAPVQRRATRSAARLALLVAAAAAAVACCAIALPLPVEAAVRFSGAPLRPASIDTFSGIPAAPWTHRAVAASAAVGAAPSSRPAVVAAAAAAGDGSVAAPMPLASADLTLASTRLDGGSPLESVGDEPDPDDEHLPFWPNLYAKFMAASYLALFVLAAVQLFRTVVHRHKIRSFRFGFLLVCWMWTALRVLFWFIVTLTTWPTWLSHLIYFLPNACQIGTFSLLILFYAKLVHRHRWRVLRLRFLSFCILANTALVLLTLTFSILMDRVQKAQQSDPTSSDAAAVQEFVNKMYFITCAIFFGVLVLLAGFYIQQLRTARRSTAGTSRQEVVVTSFIFVIFLSRCVWDFLAAFDSSSSLFRQGLWETTGKHVKLMNVETFFLLFIWEIIPTLMIIVYFRNIPATSDSYCVGLWACSPACVRTALQGWPCRFPDDYFQSADLSGSASPGPMGGGEDTSPETGESGAADEPPYHGMRDTDTTGSSSLLLPPGSFVPSNSAALSVQYAAAGSLQSAPGFGPGMQIGSLAKQPSGLGAGRQMASTGSLYGSPMWLNAQHPALAHLTPSHHAQHHAQHQHQQQQQQQQQQQHSTSYTQLAGAGAHMYDEEDYRLEQYGAHPYTAQQQQLAAQQAQLAAAAAAQQQQQQQQGVPPRPSIHAQRSRQ